MVSAWQYQVMMETMGSHTVGSRCKLSPDFTWEDTLLLLLHDGLEKMTLNSPYIWSFK